MTDENLERRWRIYSDRAVADLSDIVRSTKKEYEQKGVLRSGPCIKAIYREAARFVDAAIKSDIQPVLSRSIPSEVSLAKSALEKVVKAGQNSVLTHATWCKAYSGSTRTVIDDLCQMLGDRLILAFDTSDKGATTVEKRKHLKPRLPDSELRKWFEARVVSFQGKRPPKWQDCWNAVREQYPEHSITKERLQDMRRLVAPDWRSGRR